MTLTHLTSEITISVSPEIARTYQYLDDSDRHRLQAQITSFFQSITPNRKNTIVLTPTAANTESVPQNLPVHHKPISATNPQSPDRSKH